MRPASILTLTACVISTWATPVDAQESRVPELTARQSDRCPACSIVLERELEIGTGADEYGGVTGGYLIRDSRGWFYHTSAYTPWAVLVFDPEGRFQHAIGSAGRGPGEFINVWRAQILHGDTLLAYDQGTGRFTAFSPAGEHIYTVPVPARVSSFIQLGSAAVVVNTSRPTQVGRAIPLWLWDGRDLTPMAASEIEGELDPQNLPLVRNLAPDTDSTFWSTHWSDYVLERWHEDGRLLQRIRREPVAWLHRASRNTPEGRLNPSLYAVQAGSGGLVWVAITARDARWRERLDFGPEGRPGVRGIRSTTGNLFDLYDGILEALDPSSGEILATRRIDSVIWGFIGRDRIYTVEQDELGVGKLVVYRITLKHE